MTRTLTEDEQDNLSACAVTGQPVVADSSQPPFAEDLGLSEPLREYDVCSRCGDHLHPDASLPGRAPEFINPYCPRCAEQADIHPASHARQAELRARYGPWI